MTAPVVLELGSHSLKLHYVSRTSGIFRKSRFPWNLGHEVYATGRISSATAAKAVETIEELRRKGVQPRSAMAIATGALRDAENCREFLTLLEKRLELKVRVITGREEASLLAQAYLATSDSLPAMITDIGGGSLEFVYLGEDRTILRDSLPLGAIRLYHFAERSDGTFDDEFATNWIDDSLRDASLMTADEIFSTGGTVKAIARTLLKPTFTGEDLAELEKRTRDEGPPAGLRPDRARVLLPGLIVLRKLMEHSGAAKLTYLKVAVGRIFLQKHARRIVVRGGGPRSDLLRDLRITQIYPQNSSVALNPKKGSGEERPPAP